MKKIAYVFPGQGSQKLGMLADFYAEHAIVKETFIEANEALGFDLWEVIQNDADKLNQTQYTQPALLASSVAIYRLMTSKNLAAAAFFAGHSLGEYSALVCAGSLSFADALNLVKLRGELMQSAVPTGTGAMSAILGLKDEQVIEVCNSATHQHEKVEAANFNSPGQVVISGAADAVSRANDLAKEAGAKRAQLLPVSVPSHCTLMLPAAEKLAEALETITLTPPQIPVIHNVDVASHSNQEAIKKALVQQLYSPVQWTKTVKKLVEEGVEMIVEVGPGKVLSGLNKRIAKGVPLFDTHTLESFEALLNQ